MRRAPFSVALGFLLFLAPALFAQRGIELHGTPASVTSQAVDGRLRGIPASVTDPRAFHGTPPRHHPRRDVRPLYAVPSYGYYVPLAGYTDYDQSQQPEEQPAQASAQDDDAAQPDNDSRYGEHYFDGRDSVSRADEDRVIARATPPPAPTPVTDDGPMTTLVYRDGHKSEVRNYAIVGSNLIDLTKSPVLKKIPLDSLDLVATRKENEDNGVDFHTP